MEIVVTRFNDDELQHHGVKGMKWGVRRSRQQLSTSDTRKRYDSAKEDYKAARKAYNKSYNQAYNYSSLHPIGQFTNKKKQAESDRRWDDAINKADKLNTAQDNYRQAKRDRKQKIAETHRDINKNTKLSEKLIYNDATRKKAAKYVVDNNMTVAEATKRANKDAIRNTVAFIGVYGAITAATLYAAK